MTIRRVDSYQVKPGQERAYFALAAEFGRHLARHQVGPTTVVRVSSGGLEAGLFHAFADFESMESYGAFIDAGVADEELQKCFMRFFDADAPGTSAGSNLHVKLAAYGVDEPLNQPGVAAIVRTWAVTPGYEAVVTENIAKIAEFYSRTNSHWNVRQTFAAGDGGGP